MEISEITYINLDFRKIRKSFIEKELSQQSLPYFRTPGVVCEDFESFEIVPGIERGSPRHKGTIGCFLAHKAALVGLSEAGADQEFCLVLEDDACTTNEFFRVLAEQEFPEDAEILFFNSTMQYPGKPQPPKNEKNLYRIDRGYPMFTGAHTYVLRRGKAREAVEKMEALKTYGDVDCDFYYPNFKCYTLVTTTLSIRRFVSDRHPKAEFNAGRQNG